ncbi:MAG: response regulator [Bacteroidales bacterium]|nr:response regulator [Bacteroidales bacterium]
MNSKAKVLLVEMLPKVTQKLLGFLEKVDSIDLIESNVSNAQAALDYIRQDPPDIILMEYDLPGMNGIRVTELIKQENSLIEVIIISEVSSAETVRLAMRAGACDYINHNSVTAEELTSVVTRAVKLVEQNKEKSRTRSVYQTEVVKQKLPEIDRNGKIIVIYSSKGGAGKSSIAVNLAVTLNANNKRVVLVDGSLQYGDIATLFNRRPKNSIVEVASRVHNIDTELVERAVFYHEESGIDILPAPEQPQLAENVSGGAFGQIISFLRIMYDYIIVDTSSYISEACMISLDSSDIIVLASIQEITALRSSRAFLTLIDELEISRDRIMLIVNRYDENIHISVERISEILGQRVEAIIPKDARAVTSASNLGIPFVIQYKNRDITKAVQVLAESIVNKIGSDAGN